jgi:hypothetical protein
MCGPEVIVNLRYVWKHPCRNLNKPSLCGLFMAIEVKKKRESQNVLSCLNQAVAISNDGVFAYFHGPTLSI